jgi:hypothetical protein
MSVGLQAKPSGAVFRRDKPGGSPVIGGSPLSAGSPRTLLSSSDLQSLLLTTLLVALGLGLRSWHYFRNPSVWHDEAALIVNVLGKSFGELLGPLFFAEAAPPLFLWLEKAVGLSLGDGAFALRLVPYLASCLAMILIVPVARRVLPPAGVPWALLLFATSEALLWHACEAKPYAVDVLAAVIVLALFCCTQAWPLGRLLAVYAVLAPLIIFLCYPGGFLYGGVLVAMLPAVLRDRRPSICVSYSLLALAVFASFFLLVYGPIHAQRCEQMVADWIRMFPPWDRPWAVPGWVLLSTADVCRFACKPLGQLLAVLAVIGAIRFWHDGQRRLVVLLLLPIFLALTAACRRDYPYGGARVMAYAVPAIILLMAAGTPSTLAWLKARGRLGWARAALVLLLLSPLAVAMQRVAVPWERADAATAAEYVVSQRRPGDCVISNDWEYLYYFRDLGPGFRMSMCDPRAAGCCLVANDEAGQFRLLEDLFASPGERVWVLAKALTPEKRQDYLNCMSADGWHIVDRREYTRITLVLMERNSPFAALSAPPHSPP